MTDHHVTTSPCGRHGEHCFRIDADLGAGSMEAHVRYETETPTTCAEHAGRRCLDIVTFQRGVLFDLREDGSVDWRPRYEARSHSHAWEVLGPETRLNLDYPKVLHRGEVIPWRLANKGEATLLGWSPRIHAHVAAHAVARLLVDPDEAGYRTGLEPVFIQKAADVLLESIGVVVDAQLEAQDEALRLMGVIA